MKKSSNSHAASPDTGEELSLENSGSLTNRKHENKLGLFALIAVITGSMMGGGLYDLPKDMALKSSAGAIIIAWIVTGVGMWFIANSFRILSEAKPKITAGIFAYADRCFGKFTGFLMGWGYWIANCFANVGYAVLLMDSLDYFFPSYFKGGNNLLSILVGSVFTWIMFLILLQGVKKASILNMISTVGKLIPIFLFLVLMIITFKFHVFSHDFWGHLTSSSLGDKNLGGILPQVKATMLVTLWIFTGIEGAVVVSGRAKSQKLVSKATALAFVFAVALYMLLSILPFGMFSQGEIAKMPTPSVAGIMEKAFGPWGATFMNVGLIIAIIGAWLIWTVMLSEVPHVAATEGIFPKIFTRENKHEAPTVSLLASTFIIQVMLVFTYFAKDAWQFLYSIASVMFIPCYLISMLYLVKIATKEKSDFGPGRSPASRKLALAYGVLGAAFTLWLAYAAGVKYLALSCIIYSIGIPLFLKGRRDASDGRPTFSRNEKILCSILIVFSVVIIGLSALGVIKVMG